MPSLWEIESGRLNSFKLYLLRIDRFPNPHTQHRLSYRDLKAALLRNHLPDSPWLFKLSGTELMNGQLRERFNWILDDKTDYLVIRDCTLTNFDTISDISPFTTESRQPIGIIFIECVLPGLVVEECEITEICWLGCYLTDECRIVKNSVISHLYLQDKTITDSIEVEQSQVSLISIDNACNVHGITVRHSTNLRSIHISRSSYCFSVFVPGCAVDYISISQSSSVTNLDIAYDAIVKELHVQSSKIGTLTCWYNSIAERIRFNDATHIERINLIKGAICKELLITENTNVDWLRIEDKCSVLNTAINDSTVRDIHVSENYGSFLLNNTTIISLRISNSHLPYFEWTAHTIGQVFIRDCTINHYLLHHAIVQSGSVIACSQTRIFSVIIDELLVLGLILFRDLSCLESPQTWDEVKKFHNENANKRQLQEEYQLHLAWKPSYVRQNYEPALFHISNSSLGKSEITGSNIRDFYLEYRNSKILDMFISGTNFPKENIHIIHDNSEKKVYTFQQLNSIYDQLKRLYESQGNLVEASWYHSRAMHFQEKLAHLTERRWPHMSISKGLGNWLEAKAYRLNALSNSHGESWPRALLFIILTSILLYTTYYVTLHYHLNFSWKGADEFIKNYFSFLDPTHKSDFLQEKSKLSIWSTIVDFLGRVVIGYGIYQFIAAFRRHGRKGY